MNNTLNKFKTILGNDNSLDDFITLFRLALQNANFFIIPKMPYHAILTPSKARWVTSVLLLPSSDP